LLGEDIGATRTQRPPAIAQQPETATQKQTQLGTGGALKTMQTTQLAPQSPARAGVAPPVRARAAPRPQTRLPRAPAAIAAERRGGSARAAAAIIAAAPPPPSLAAGR